MNQLITLREFATTAQPGDTYTERGSVHPDDRSLRTYTAGDRIDETRVQAVVISTAHSKRRGGGTYLTSRSDVTVEADQFATSVQYGDLMRNMKHVGAVDAGPRYNAAKHAAAHDAALTAVAS